MDRFTRIPGGSSLWIDGSPASVIINNDFFGSEPEIVNASGTSSGLADTIGQSSASAAVSGSANGQATTSAAGSLYLSLHTADPGEAGTQATSEATYGGYARQAIARSGSGFTVAGNAVSNAAAITFPAATSGSQTVTHWGLGTDPSGSGKLLYKGALTPTIPVAVPVSVNFPIGDLDITED